ncbi:MAG TPA: putative toxin-antitoxin system toxin component, PIN family [Vicinamibacteria bacterium]|nr:putative toxin-antitoxin system toxin component, PIN family [Vicinamibacteria bacterium]
MARVVVDANVYLSALIRPQGPPGQIIKRLLREGAHTVIVSKDILEEVRKGLDYPKVRKKIDATDEELDAWVESLGVLADVVSGVPDVRVVESDPDDDLYVAAALDGRADFIVSGDRHLVELEEVQGVRIVTPRQFLDLLDDSTETSSDND